MQNHSNGKSVIGARLSRHFVAAATVTAASAFFASTDASAGVVHRTFNVVIPNNIDGLYINVESGVTGSAAGLVTGWDLNPYGTSTTAISWFGATGGGCVTGLGQGGTTVAVANIAANTVIGSASTFANTASSVTAGGWQLNAVNIFGFRFVAADGLTHYGWGKMQIGATMGVRTLLDVGYESTAATQILAGDEGTAPPPPYDACSASNPSASVGANTLYMASNAPDYAITGDCSFNITHANFFPFTAPASGTYTVDTCSSGVDTRLAVLSGCSAGSTVLACNDDFCGTSSSLTFAATGGTKYYIAVGGTTSTALSSPLAVTVTAPTFDSCALATNGSLGTNAITTNAFLANLGPLTCGTSAQTLYKAQYLRFTAPGSTSYQISLCNTSPSADTVMAVLTSCGDATSVIACNDDSCGLLSQLSFTASGGTTYYIAIGGYSATTNLPATITADITEVAPPINPCDPANILAGVAGDQTVVIDYTYPAFNSSAGCSGLSINHAKFVQFTATADGDYTVSTCNTATAPDTVIAALTACGDATSILACNDDSCGAMSQITFTGTNGVTYYFAVGGYATTLTGPVTLTIQVPPPPANPSDLNGDGVVNAADLSALLGNWGGSGVGDINGDGTVGAADLAILLGAWS